MGQFLNVGLVGQFLNVGLDGTVIKWDSCQM